MKMKRMSMILIGLVLCAAIIIGLAAGQMPAAKADGEKTIVGLGTTEIANPADGAGGWSQVYFGSKDTQSTPILFNVLKNRETNFTSATSPTLLLYCASILQYLMFDDDGEPNQTGRNANEWAYSDIRTWLNGTFQDGHFTTAEISAIAASSKSAKGSEDGNGWWVAEIQDGLTFASLMGEKIFLLDAVEATNTAYGFASTDSSNITRVKKPNGSANRWWLRSPYFLILSVL